MFSGANIETCWAGGHGRQAQPLLPRRRGAVCRGATTFTQYLNTPGSDQTEQHLGRGNHKRTLPKEKQIRPAPPVADILGTWELPER